MNITGTSNNPSVAAVVGDNTAAGDGVFGIGVGQTGRGVVGTSQQQNAVTGVSTNGNGVWGESQGAGSGVSGHSGPGRGIEGFSKTWQGVYGYSETQAGVVGESQTFDGVFGVSHNLTSAGVSGHNPGGLAGYFDGDVVVTGDIRLLNADCAEDFDVFSADRIEPGTVMVFGEGGALQPSRNSYDRRVAGVISGAGAYKPGIVLDKRESPVLRQPVALMGKVFCMADAQEAPIEAGDLLTTSNTPGHAMKVIDHSRAFGAVIGKSLGRLESGTGLIAILVSLQ